MATSVVPALIDALVAQSTTALPSVLVIDGTGVTSNPGDYLMVGVEDAEAAGTTLAASSSEVPGPYSTNRPRDEVGEVVLTAESWNGAADQKAARDAVYAIAAAVANLCRTSTGTALGVSGVLWTGYGSTSQLEQVQTDRGAIARLTFRVAFRARI